MKKLPASQCFDKDKDLQSSLAEWLKPLVEEFYDDGIQMLRQVIQYGCRLHTKICYRFNLHIIKIL